MSDILSRGARRKAQGLCVDCPNSLDLVTFPNGRRCTACLEKYAERRKATRAASTPVGTLPGNTRYAPPVDFDPTQYADKDSRARAKKQALGLCQDCPNPIDLGVSTIRCKPCVDKYNAQRRDRRHSKVSQGICHVASCTNPVEGRYHKCTDCRTTGADKILGRQTTRKEEGTCVRCGKDYYMSGQENNAQPLCETCWFSEASNRAVRHRGAAQELKDMLIAQNYKCPYTGKLLVPGINASIDHKKPVSRFPELQTDIDNIQWVDLSVNIMKRDKTPEEFLALIELIRSVVV